jgi:hypothetical protein
MHTSTILRSTDFRYWSLAGEERLSADFGTFCVGYHALDRVGVVSPCLEDGIRYTGYALLALTTAFYDRLRVRAVDFFDYPHHFAFLDINHAGVRTHAGRLLLEHATLGSPWGGLAVWPDSNWIGGLGSAAGMLKKVFDWQISRLFWPEDLRMGADEPRFPFYIRRLLSTRLKTVYYYNTLTPTIAIGATPQVAALVEKSVQRLPEAVRALYMVAMPSHHAPDAADGFPYVEQYRQIGVEAFLEAMAHCFEAA